MATGVRVDAMFVLAELMRSREKELSINRQAWARG
jgi:hypothetical protein